jgi:hypothetical protein
MPIPRPPRGARWLLAQAGVYDLLIALFACAIGFTSAWNYASQGRRLSAVLVGLGTVGVLCFSAAKQLLGLAAAWKKDSTHELEGCLHTLHAVLAPETCRLRLAIHVPIGEMLEQVTEYIGDRPKPGRIGRLFPANAGIIGKAFREKEVFIARRVNDDYESYVQELVKDWNFIEERARRLNPGAMAWMAVPFYDTEHQRVEAVLFLDANDRDFFTPERQELVLAAVSGIAVFIGKRYTQHSAKAT